MPMGCCGEQKIGLLAVANIAVMASQKIPHLEESLGSAGASAPRPSRQLPPWLQPSWAVDVRLPGMNLLVSPWHADFISGFVTEHLAERPFVVMKAPQSKEVQLVHTAIDTSRSVVWFVAGA